MSTIRINLPLEVQFGQEVDEKEFRLRVTRLMANAWAGDPNLTPPAVESFLTSAQDLFIVAAAWAVAVKSAEHDYAEAKKIVELSGTKVSLNQRVKDD